MNATETKTLFESESCSRCGGGGHYSYCAAYGTTCFKCRGRGITLTKRGNAAQIHFNQLCSKRAGDLKIGDRIREDSITGGGKGCWATVAFVGVKETDSGYYENGTRIPYFCVDTNVCSHGTTADEMFRVSQTDEERATKVALALEYQASLTKRGKPRKVAQEVVA